MKSMRAELWHGNIIPQEDSRNNSPEMKELMEYMARHHDDLYVSLAEAAIFEYAFKLGMQVAIETLTE